MRINYKLFRGSINRNLIVNYAYHFEPTGDFQTVTQRENGSVSILPSFGISISEGFDKDRVYISANQYYIFSSLLKKTVKLISEILNLNIT